MEFPIKHKNENERLNALKSYSILDTLQEKEYDDITFIASQICETPISYISLIDENRQWLKSRIGLNFQETPREISFCAHTIVSNEDIMIIMDARKDQRFSDNPLVKDDPKIVFYLGVPLYTQDGYPIGTLCVVDKKPKELSENQIEVIKALARQTIRLLEARKNNLELEFYKKDLEGKNKSLNEFARLAAHDLKSPLNNIIQLIELQKLELEENNNKSSTEILTLIENSSYELSRMIDGILKYSLESSISTKDNIEFKVLDTIKNVFETHYSTSLISFHITYDLNEKLTIYSNKTAFEQILINLISNSQKYNDKDLLKIKICASKKDDNVVFTFEDNGLGIKEKEIASIFNLYETTSNIDKFGKRGTGIGLSTVKKLIELLGGTITVSSEVGVKTIFEFSLKDK